ncbi:protein PTHB1 [Onthophagus taurus]|uniref:protein PTHB1 n=1 Tax=Onthophagus taurus TaxID=166361 RepID=UPI0039BE7010
MSLFQTKELWSNQCSDSNVEEFDQNALKISQLNGSRDNIIVGSHSGVLRIYQPSIFIPGDINNFKANDLLVEKVLDVPILQLDTGKYVSGSQQIQIALLHPRSLTVYSLTIKDAITEHGVQFILELLYEHKLRRTSFNFTSGSFGNVQNRDFICVQSLDGLLSFFEQETFNFCCFLSDFLLPGPLVYVRSSDSFITCGSSWKLESYSYKNLSNCGSDNHDDDHGRNVLSNWSYNVGEGVLDIQTIYDDVTRTNFIAVLGEKHLYCFNDGGKLRFMKKFEFICISFHFYFLNDGTPMFLVISDNNTMFIYQQTTVKWSAKLQFLPIASARLTYLHIMGCLVFLSESGFLQINYLGTDPNIFSAPPLKNQELDFDAAEKELESLQKIIRGNTPIVNTHNENELTTTIFVSPHFKESEISSNRKYCEIQVEIIPKSIFEEVHVSMFVQPPLIISPRAHYYTNFSNTTSAISYVHLESTISIPNLTVEVSISCITSLGGVKLYQKRAEIPLHLVMESTGPLKESECKVTLNINENPVLLSELFPEYIGENSFSMSSNAIGFKMVNNDGPVITLLTAKSSQRYRIQSEDFSSLNVIVQELIRRLEKYYAATDNFKITFTSSLPVMDVIKYIQEHFQIVQDIKKLQNELQILSSQFRLIQKRLVVKYNQKNPTSLANLDIVLHDTFEDIMRVVENLTERKDLLLKAQIKLSSALQLISTLIKLLDNNNNANVIDAALCTYVFDIENQNWEDVVDTTLCYLIRTVLSKSEKDKHRAPHTSFEEVKDINKLEKHFSQVLDRVSKRRSNNEKEITHDTEPSKVITAKSEDVEEFGTEIAKSSSRILTARRNLLSRTQKLVE